MEEKDMDFPLKNKEELPEDKLIKVSRSKYRWSIIGNIVLGAFSMMGLVLPAAFDYLQSEDKKIMQDVVWQRKIDSVLQIQEEANNRKIQKQTYRNISMVNEYMNELRTKLPKSSGISLYYTHDSGGVPVSGSPLNLTILYAANNEEPCLGKAYWQNVPLPEGYFNFNHRLYNNKFLYIPDVTQEVDIYKDETKEQIDCNGTRTMMGILLKETQTGAYFIAIGWKIENVLTENRRASIELRKYAKLIEPLIQGKKRT